MVLTPQLPPRHYLNGLLKMRPKKVATGMLKLWGNRSIEVAEMFNDPELCKRYLLKAAQCELELHRRGEVMDPRRDSLV